jgi:glyoxylate/hydroxypyruvate reductase A
MTILLTTGYHDASAWRAALADALPGREVAVYGVDRYDPAAIRYACTWHPPKGMLKVLPNLEVIFNLGAGVDGVLSDPELPDVPIVRLVDDDLTERMGEWVTLQVLNHHRGTLTYLARQKRREWKEDDQPAARDVSVGLMGYGTLAAHAARILKAIGYRVHGWSRSDKPADVPLFAGEAGLGPFLAATDVLVALLPLTADTRGILNARLFASMRREGIGPVLINAGRGGLQNERDILEALRSGALRGASLDVFNTEPLPPDASLWAAPNLIITPHCAAVSEPGAVSRYVAGQIARHERGDPVENVVDRSRGY